MSLALLWRRRVPLVVLAFVFTSGALLYLAVGAPEALGTFLPPLAAVYAVGRYAESRALVLAAPLALLGTAIHELKDPNATVKYHTGIDMKSVQDLAPKSDPTGKLSNRPVQVEDNLEAIVRAMGGDAGMLKGMDVRQHKSNVPVAEF